MLARLRRPLVVTSMATLLSLEASPVLGQHAGHGTHAPDKKETATPFRQSVEGLPEAKPMEIVELADGAVYTLTAAPVKQKVRGKWLARLAYNGSIPGPILKVKQGSSVRVILKNETDIETTLHPHGLRIDEKNDGVPGVGQAAIPPGKSHEYVLRFPDAGMYWYHPHVREDYAQDAGLYGNFWVEPREAGFYNAVHREVPLLLDDVLVEGAPPFLKERVTHTLMGRYGDVMLVNGGETFQMAANAGEVVRFFVTNTSNSRPFELRIPGVKLKLVGGDNGLYERETFVDSVTISPSERYIVEAELAKAGTFEIVNDKPSGRVTLGRIEVAKGNVPKLPTSFAVLRAPATAAASLKEVKAKLNVPVTKTMRLTMTMDHDSLPMDMGHHGHGAHGNHAGQGKTTKAPPARKIEWDDEMAAMNGKSDDRNVVWKIVDDATKQENMAIDWGFKKGELAKIRIVNDADSMHPMQHPIHFHGQRFVVAAIDGKPVDNLVWKDSVLVAAGETVDIILEASSPGRWMAHCHIAEHLGAGMMIGFRVTE